jgi:hypothetical protein
MELTEVAAAAVLSVRGWIKTNSQELTDHRPFFIKCRLQNM